MGHRVLLGVTGGIAAFKSAEVLRRLQERGHEVRCAMSRGAESFLTPLTLEVLSGHAVYREEYLTPTGRGEESHLAAAAWADALCVAPATAHVLGRLALGLADDFLTTTALAFRGALVVAPAMHPAMWEHPAVRHHVATLEARGVERVGPVTGALASGETGMGRLAEPAAIVAAVEEALGRRASLAGRRVLVTAGPTHEPLDAVRFLGNRSSGRMGFALAAEAARRGAETTLVAGPVELPTPHGTERIDVTTAVEMRDAVYRRAPGADLVIMAAAVADFRPVAPAAGKLKKESGPPELRLEATPDILSGLAEVAPEAVRVGFAAETAPTEEAARRKLEAKAAHFLAVNDVSRAGIGFGAEENEVILYRRDGPPVRFDRRPKARLAADLLDLVTGPFNRERPG